MAEPIVKTLEEARESRVGLNVCAVCHNDIHVMCRKYTGICSENCDKKAKEQKKSRDFPIAG